MKRLAGIIFPIAILATLTSCIGYRHQAFRLQSPLDVPSDDSYALAYVELDELGWFWDPSQANRALDLIQHRAETGSVVVVTFVHGWNNDANCCNDNVECFRASLRILSEQLNQESSRLALQENRDQPISVIGVYVGWRGRSIPGVPVLGNFTTFPSFWSRKRAAERIGSGDLRNFLHQLGRIHGERTLREDRFFGLVTIGHSFGGQAVFRATSQLLEHQLIEAGPSAFPRRSATGAAGPAFGRGVQPSADRGAYITGLGDLIVLVNPAIEASAFEPMNRLAAAVEFDPEAQNPVMVVFSAGNDVEREILFPMGRVAGSPLSPRRRGQRLADRLALGVYTRQRTHTLEWSPPGPGAITYQAPTIAGVHEADNGVRGRCKPCRYRGDSLDIPNPELDNLPQNGDFGGSLTLAGSQLQPLSSARPFSPLLVIRTESEIIDGHGGFFSHRFTNFLIRYVGGIEARQAANRRARRSRLSEVSPASPGDVSTRSYATQPVSSETPLSRAGLGSAPSWMDQ